MQDQTEWLLEELVTANPAVPPATLARLHSALAGEPIEAYLYVDGVHVDEDGIAVRDRVGILTPTRFLHVAWINQPREESMHEMDELAMLNSLLDDAPAERNLRVATASTPLAEIADVRVDVDYDPADTTPTGVAVLVLFKTLNTLHLEPQTCGDEGCSAVHAFSGVHMQDFVGFALSADVRSVTQLNNAISFADTLSLAIARGR